MLCQLAFVSIMCFVYFMIFTSSIKPEVHNVLQRPRGKTEPRPQGMCTKHSWRSVQRFQRYAGEQTDRHTDRQVGWSQYSAPVPGRSKYRYIVCVNLMCYTVAVRCSACVIALHATVLLNGYTTYTSDSIVNHVLAVIRADDYLLGFVRLSACSQFVYRPNAVDTYAE